MQKLMIGQSVYIITEAYRRYNENDVIDHMYYKIAKYKVVEVPNGGLREYKLQNKGKLYWKTRNCIYETYQEAVKVAEFMSDEYDRIWSKLDKRKLYRHWRLKNGME